MNRLDKDYQALLQDILDNGVEKETRNGKTLSVFGRQIRHKMSEGFPLLTTKKMAFKTMVTELLWFLKGDTNIKYLVDNGCHIWNGDAYKAYVKYWEPNIEYIDGKAILTQEEFINKIKTDDEFAYKWGDLGPVYGAQWRSWHWRSEPFLPEEKYMIYTTEDKPVTWSREKYIDQIQNLINDLKTNPDSRRLMVSAWNVGELDQMVLPPCHYGFQVYTRKTTRDEKIVNPGKYRAISLMWNQRSVDTFLGLPFNIASYGLLLEIIAKEVNMIPDELIGNLGDVHLYSNHIEQAKEQIGRKYTPEERHEMLKASMGDFYQIAVDEQVPFGGGLSEYYESYKIPYHTRVSFKLPTLVMVTNPDLKFDEYVYDNFKLVNYQSHPAIKAPLSN
jgi:thymidylate synthase